MPSSSTADVAEVAVSIKAAQDVLRREVLTGQRPNMTAQRVDSSPNVGSVGGERTLCDMSPQVSGICAGINAAEKPRQLLALAFRLQIRKFHESSVRVSRAEWPRPPRGCGDCAGICGSRELIQVFPVKGRTRIPVFRANLLGRISTWLTAGSDPGDRRRGVFG